MLTHPLTAFNFQRAGLGVQREAAEVHVAHGSDCDAEVKTQRVATQKKTLTTHTTFLYRLSVLLLFSSTHLSAAKNKCFPTKRRGICKLNM